MPGAVGPDGALYLIDGHSFARKVVQGRLTTVAGPLVEEVSYEDGRRATETGLREIVGIAVDGKGGVYLSDGFDRIRYIDPVSRTVSTIA